jgi:hypothetical protein
MTASTGGKSELIYPRVSPKGDRILQGKAKGLDLNCRRISTVAIGILREYGLSSKGLGRG